MIVSSLALALTASVAAADTTSASPPSTEVLELRERVAKLESKISEMQAADGERWLTEERAASIRGIVSDVLADSDARSSLADGGGTSGWEKGKGFFVQSADGNYLLRVAGQIQFRAVWNHQNNSPSDDDRYGFEMRRAKLFFRGHIIDPSWSFEFELDSSRSGGGVSAGENLWIQKDLGGGFKIKAGQLKPAYLREEMVSSRNLLAVERSQVNSLFTAGITHGVQFAYEAEKWRAFAAVIDGFNTAGTAWTNEENEFAATVRAECLILGDWKSAADDTAFRGTENTLLVGLAGSYQKAEYGTTTNAAEVEDVGLTGDVTFKSSGWSIAGSLIYRSLEADAIASSRDQWGAVVRGGFFVTDDIEIYGLYEWGDLDTLNVAELSTLTLGVAKFFDGHNLKWQTDVGFGFNPVSSSWAQAGAGWRGDAADEDGQVVIRSQLQLLF